MSYRRSRRRDRNRLYAGCDPLRRRPKITLYSNNRIRYLQIGYHNNIAKTSLFYNCIIIYDIHLLRRPYLIFNTDR